MGICKWDSGAKLLVGYCYQKEENKLRPLATDKTIEVTIRNACFQLDFHKQSVYLIQSKALYFEKTELFLLPLDVTQKALQ